MKPIHVILQVFLVALGLFIYEQARDPEPPRTSAPSRDAPEDDEGLGPVLGVDNPGEELAALRLRMANLERKWAEREAAATVTKTGIPALPDAAAIDVPSPAPVFDPKFSEEEIARFRALTEAARRQAQLERVRSLAGRQLDSIPGDPITADERSRVLDESLRAWLRARQVGHLETARAEAASRTLQADYFNAVREIVWGTRAEVIVQKLSPLLGLTASALQTDEVPERR